MISNETLAARMKAKTEVNKSGCHVWRGTHNNAGYGMVFYDSRWHMAHRLAWSLANGPIPQGMLVMHTCDNPPCVNPEHLAIGTYADNSRDMVLKGRSTRGRRYRTRRGSTLDLGYRSKINTQAKNWRKRNPERWREIQRDWRRRRREEERQARQQTPEWRERQLRRKHAQIRTEERERLRASCYSMPEIAELAGVHRSTVLRWIESGRLKIDSTGETRGLCVVSPDVLFPFLTDWQKHKHGSMNTRRNSA